MLKSIFCMCKRTDERTYKERQERKKTTEMVKKNRRDIKEMRRQAGQEVSPDGSGLQSEAESSPEQVTDFETLMAQGRAAPQEQFVPGYGMRGQQLVPEFRTSGHYTASESSSAPYLQQ